MFDSQKIIQMLRVARRIPARQRKKRQEAWQQFAAYLLEEIPEQSRTYQLTKSVFEWICYTSHRPLAQETGQLFIFLREQTESAYLLYLFGMQEGVDFQRNHDNRLVVVIPEGIDFQWSHNNRLAVFIPASSAFLATLVARGSAIVGRAIPDESGHIVVYYEGAVYNQANMVTYADRADYAAGRLLHNASTSSRITVQRGDLLQVGWFDTKTGITLFDGAEKAVSAWMGVEALDPKELHFSN